MKKQKRGGSRLEKNVRQSAQSRKSSVTPDGQQDPSPKKNAAAPKGKQSWFDSLKQWQKILLIVMLSLVLVALICVIWKYWPRAPKRNVGPYNPMVGENGEEHVNPMVDVPLKKNFYTFLVAGRDTGGGGNTDTMMLVAYDIDNQKVSVMSIPRDTMVDARHKDGNRKLNGVWNLGVYYAKKDDKRPGVEYLKEAIGDMMGFVPDYYVVVNWNAFGRLVDTIDGVDFEVERNMNYDDPTQDLHIHVNKGYQHLNGTQAMGVVRWRQNNDGSGYATGDIGRIQTQQKLMTAIIKKCLRLDKLITNIPAYAKIFIEEVDTDLKLDGQGLIYFGTQAVGGLDMENVKFVTMPNTPVYVGNESYVQANAEELLALLNESFNPYTEDITMDALHIQQYSSSAGYYIYNGVDTSTKPVYTKSGPARVNSSSSGSNATASPKSEQGAKNSDAPETSTSPSPSGSAPSSASPGAGSSKASASPGASPSSNANASPSASASNSKDNPPKESDPPATERPSQSSGSGQPEVGSGANSGAAPGGIPMD